MKIRSTDALEWTSVPDTVDATSVFTSPDGEWAGYSTRSGLFKVRVDGGAPVALATMKASATYGVFASGWGDDHRIYYTSRTGLSSRPMRSGWPCMWSKTRTMSGFTSWREAR